MCFLFRGKKYKDQGSSPLQTQSRNKFLTERLVSLPSLTEPVLLCSPAASLSLRWSGLLPLYLPLSVTSQDSLRHVKDFTSVTRSLPPNSLLNKKKRGSVSFWPHSQPNKPLYRGLFMFWLSRGTCSHLIFYLLHTHMHTHTHTFLAFVCLKNTERNSAHR